MSKSRVFLYFCLSFVAGIFVDSIFSVPRIIVWGFFVAGIGLISVFWSSFAKASEDKHSFAGGFGRESTRRKFVIFGFCVLFLATGIWRHSSVIGNVSNDLFFSLRDTNENLAVIGVIATDPEIKSDKLRFTVVSQKAEINGAEQEISGKILVSVNRYPEYSYGDQITMEGKLKTPSEDISGFNYKDYLKKENIYSVMYNPTIEFISSGNGNFVYGALFALKHKLKEGLGALFLPPQQGLMEALFFGDEEKFSQDFKDKLNLTGTRHIAAVSGMNITIIAGILMFFLLGAGLWRGQAFYIVIGFLILYILMIGAPASAIRAGIMGGILLLARNVGRRAEATRAVVFASTAMVFFNPAVLTLDVGFQLSFLAVLGLIYFQPLLMEKLKFLPEFLGLRSTLAATFSAQIFTLPILVYNFGRVSLVSPLANMLIVPLIPLITVAGMILSFAGIIFQPIAQILSWPIWLLLTWIITLVDWLAAIPLASATLKNIHWIWLAISYIILGAVVFWIRKKSRLARRLSDNM